MDCRQKNIVVFSPYQDFIILTSFSSSFFILIFHSLFGISNLSTAFCHPQFSIPHPPSAIRSTFYRDPALQVFCAQSDTSMRNFARYALSGSEKRETYETAYDKRCQRRICKRSNQPTLAPQKHVMWKRVFRGGREFQVPKGT